MRKMSKQPDRQYNEWDFDIEVGMRLYRPVYSYSPEYKIARDRRYCTIYDVEASSGWGKRNAGELYPRLVKKNGLARFAVKKDLVWYWV